MTKEHQGRGVAAVRPQRGRHDGAAAVAIAAAAVTTAAAARVDFPGPLVTAVAGGAAPPAPSARPGRAPLLSHAW